MTYYDLDYFYALVPEINNLRGLMESESAKLAMGSSYNHQAWNGGYFDHVREVLNIAKWLYDASPRQLPFKREECYLILILHDLEKLYKDQYKWSSKEDRRIFRENVISQNQIALSKEQWNALRYVEGEGDDYSSKKRTMNPLAGFCHVCDTFSARVWHDYGDKQEW